ncbi:AMP-binding protein [Noviherbaspirillum saxi]|uniref:AMP-binding acetyl-CoA synthetase n=1 Tax=Noviherbaspirillum saxi TaxID=2320863 RepID=A0A3A3FTF4_9BURK|nr:AMP-binding protein [Noviherbaspirillum saxi]RJF98544.1 AMP-binding acetyl-CoA synthetase [Noviherbaspirillum saxi]
MNEKNTNTLMHRFLHWERTQPDAVLFTQPTPDGRVVDYTWKDVGDQARRMATYLRSLQLPPNSNIAILGKNNAHWIMADVAIWMAGHISVPLYPTMNADTAQYVFEHSNTRLLFVGKLDGKTDGWNEISKVLPAHMHVVTLPMAPATDAQQWDALIDKVQPLQEVHLPRPEDLATIIYTSGTTGKPKGVMHSFGNTYTYAMGAGDFCGTTPNDRVLSYLPLAHGAERSFVESNALCHGLHVYFNDSLETFAQDLQRARPTLFISMPRLWTKFYLGICAKLPAEQQKLLFAPPEVSNPLKKHILTLLGLESVRMAFTGSAPLPVEIFDWYRNLGLELLDVYGMTENFAYSHYSRPGQVRLGYSGQALPGVQSRIAENGEIEVKCPTHMMGYYKQPELTAESMTADGFFKTGDRGEVDELGRLKITGRIKELFKTSKGKYVSPAPIENKLTHQKVEAVCVTGPGHPQPFALMMLAPDARKALQDAQASEILQAELQTLLDSVNTALEDHEKLNYLVIVKDIWTTDNGFLTPTMKIKRNIIEDRYLSKAQNWSALGKTIILETD